MVTPPLTEQGLRTSGFPAGVLTSLRALVLRIANANRLQLILFFALVSISAVPVLLLAAWVQTDALEQEIRSVRDKHLLIAQNLGGALERYVTDVKESFRVAAENAYAIQDLEGFDTLLRTLNYRYVAKFDDDNQLIGYLMLPEKEGTRTDVPPELLAELRKLADTKPGEVFISDLLRVNDEPLFFVVCTGPEHRLVIGALEPTFVKTVQREIVFGERGHSMIVDRKGTVIAHPNADWEATSKDASGLSVVQKMMRGETGVATFYSPPMQADMIAGHTSVPSVGWGVMVPQPIQELEERANAVRNIAVILTAIGILVAAILGWLLARYISAPVTAVSAAASEVAGGGLHTRVEDPRHSPRELRVLATSFNRMLSELEQREMGLRIAKDEAETANRSKSEFLANISHELRTPLNAVIGFSDLMRNEIHGPLGAQQYHDYLDDIHGSGSHLLGIINDVLDMSKVEAGRMELHQSVFDLRGELQTCMRMMSERADVGGVSLKLDASDNLPLLHADGRIVRQIVINLLSNAIKFTGKGGDVMVSALVAEDGCYVIKVTDSGIGIPPEYLDTIMQPFVQVESGMSRNYEGTGLGLSLVKSMVELHGGTVSIDSAPGTGTTVTVRFPAERVRA